MNNENGKLGAPAPETITTVSQDNQSEQNAQNAPAAAPVPKRRQHYYNIPPGDREPFAQMSPVEEENPAAEPEDELDAEASQNDPRSKNAMTLAIAAAIIVAGAVVGFLGYLFFSNLNNFGDSGATADSAPATTEATEPMTENALANMVIMPDLSDLSETEAYKRLNESKVKYKVARIYSDYVSSNYVVSQYPVAGTEISTNELAVVYVSKGNQSEVIEPTTKPTSSSGSSSSKTKESSASSKSSKTTEGDYILPDSASRRLKKSDLKDLDRETLNLALNEIFARHGRKFSDSEIRAYFESKDWYKGTIASKDFDMSILNQYESYNVNLISSYQAEKGYR